MATAVSLCEKKLKFGKLQFVFKVQRCLGNSELSREQNFFVGNSTCPVGQVLLEIHLSEIREYVSRTGGQVQKFFALRHMITSFNSCFSAPLMLLFLYIKRAIPPSKKYQKDNTEPLPTTTYLLTYLTNDLLMTPTRQMNNRQTALLGGTTCLGTSGHLIKCNAHS